MYKLKPKQIQIFIKRAAQNLFEYCRQNNLHYTVTGVSGGLDSAVTLGLAEQAFLLAKKEGYSLHHLALVLPCHSAQEHLQRGNEVIKKFTAEKIEIDLSQIFDFIKTQELDNINQQVANIIKKTSGAKVSEEDLLISQGNIKARLRMMLGTYHVARLIKGIVLSTDNYSEFLMGFWTICGDVGDYGMIQNVFKGLELYDIARELGVPQSVLEARPDDGLGIKEGGDEAQLGVNYSQLDEVMICLLQAGYDPDQLTELPADIPQIKDVSLSQIKELWRRSVTTRHKRKGGVYLQREELGLPGIKDIEWE